MSKEVNLISSRRKDSSVSYKQLQIIKRVAYALLGVCVLVSVAIFGINSTSEIGALSQKEKSLNQTLLASQRKIVKIALVKERLKSISDLTNKSTTYEDILVSVSNALSKDSTFDTFEITRKNLNVTVTSSSLLSVNSFLDFVINKVNKKQLFQKVTVSSLIGDIQSGKYNLTLEITLL